MIIPCTTVKQEETVKKFVVEKAGGRRCKSKVRC